MALSTGISSLDRTLDGGVAPGSVVAVVAPPEAQVEPLLCASVHLRTSWYFATIRTEDDVRRRLERSAPDSDVERVENVGVEEPLDRIRDRAADLGERQDVIVDVMDPIETSAETADYVGFLNEFSQRIIDTDSVAFLSCLDSGTEPDNRELTLSVADYVWRLVPERQGKKIRYALEIPKASGVPLAAEDRVFELDVGRYVRIDRTRNI